MFLALKVKDVHVQVNGEVVSVPQATFHSILFVGDHLTAARARGAKKARVNSVTPVSHLEGMIPCAEDWHARLNLLDVSNRKGCGGGGGGGGLRKLTI